MLESMNDYISFFILLFIISFFIIQLLSAVFKSVEIARIRKAMIRRDKETKGES